MLKRYKLSSYNFVLLFLLIITCAYALMIVNSAKPIYTMKQGLGMAIAFIIMIVISFIDYNWVLKYYWIWYTLAAVLLIGVLIFGKSSHGATRWIAIGGQQIQPSEFLKVILILFMSKFLANNKERINDLRFLLIFALIVGFPLVLVVVEPDLSTTILLALVILTVIFCAGLSYKIIGIALLIVVPVVAGFLIYVISVDDPIIIKDYQRDRIISFIKGSSDENIDYDDPGVYQQSYAVQAIGSGQLTGKGLNNNDTSSLKNAGYIAEAQNDFIFAVIGEELGFVGCCITIILLFLIVIQCIIVAVKAKNFEGRLICCGIASYIAFQTFINIGVVTWILPNTGIPLPFFSCGLTSLVTLFAAMGFVLNISLQRTIDRDDDIFSLDFKG